MNTILLTKIAKHISIGSLSAYLSFAGKHNLSVKLFFTYTLAGIIAVFVVAALWEARDYLTAQNPTEEQLTTLVSGLSGQKSGRKYYLSAQTRLEIVITFVVIIMCALVGSI